MRSAITPTTRRRTRPRRARRAQHARRPFPSRRLLRWLMTRPRARLLFARSMQSALRPTSCRRTTLRRAQHERAARRCRPARCATRRPTPRSPRRLRWLMSRPRARHLRESARKDDGGPGQPDTLAMRRLRRPASSPPPMLSKAKQPPPRSPRRLRWLMTRPRTGHWVHTASERKHLCYTASTSVPLLTLRYTASTVRSPSSDVAWLRSPVGAVSKARAHYWNTAQTSLIQSGMRFLKFFGLTGIEWLLHSNPFVQCCCGAAPTSCT